MEHKGSLKKLVAWKSKIHSDIWKPWQSRIKVLCLEKPASLRLFFSQQFIHIRHSTIQMSDWMKIWSWTFMIIEQIIAHTDSKKYLGWGGMEGWYCNGDHFGISCITEALFTLTRALLRSTRLLPPRHVWKLRKFRQFWHLDWIWSCLMWLRFNLILFCGFVDNLTYPSTKPNPTIIPNVNVKL